MNVLLVYAHPGPASLNASLKQFAIEHLQDIGHHVRVSDLYDMNWKAPLDATDFPFRDGNTPFDPVSDSRIAYDSHTQSLDISAEQEKVRWADTVILQFPLWWFSMPAILKGWIDRVWACGFAYGVGEHSDKHWGDRYGEGVMAGKRAMLIVTAGGWESHYSARGINGPMEDLLFPIQHGILWYPGFDVLPPFIVYQTGKMNAERISHINNALAARLDTLDSAAPLPFRRQNFGDYAIPSLTLNTNILPEKGGFGVHLQSEN